MSDLESALGQALPATVTVSGQAIEVRPLTLRQLGPFTRAMEPLGGLDLGDVMAIARHTEAVVEAIAVATGRDLEWLWGLSPEDLVVLAGAVVEVNARFFSRTLAPAIAQALARVEQGFAGPS